MTRLVALLAVASLATTTTGCATGSGAKSGLIVGGLAMGVAGALVTSAGVVDSNNNGVNENVLDDDFGAYLVGATLLVGGLAMLTAGLASSGDEAPRPVYTPPVQPMLAFAPPSIVAQPARLPEMPATSETVREAQQIRTLVSDGHCDAAWTMWHQLDTNDHAYAASLRTSEVMAPCPLDLTLHAAMR